MTKATSPPRTATHHTRTLGPTARPPWGTLLLLFALACSGDPAAPPVARTGSLTGVVTADWWGTPEPVVGATVRMSETSISTTTDAAGRYRFEAVPVGSYRLRIEAPLHEAATAAGIEVPEDDTGTADVTLRREVARIVGTASNRLDSSPVGEGGRVDLRPEGRDTAATVVLTSGGAFDLELPMGRYRVAATSSTGEALFDFEQDSVARIESPTFSLDLRLLPLLADGLFLDFEAPALGFGEWNRTVDPWVDPVGGARFSAMPHPNPAFTPVTGVVVNAFTSVCAPPLDLDQKLGTGMAGSGASGSTSSVGFSGGPIRMELAGWLMAGSTVSVEFQASASGMGRVVAVDPRGEMSGPAEGSLGPELGTCVPGRPPIGRARVTLPIEAPTSVLLFEVVDPVGANSLVWVLDDVEVVPVGSPPVP